jgi:hypothetical protein
VRCDYTVGERWPPTLVTVMVRLAPPLALLRLDGSVKRAIFQLLSDVLTYFLAISKQTTGTN